MAKFFVPYTGNKPAALSINGHRLLILSKDRSVFDIGLDRLGATRVRRISIGDSQEEEELIMQQLAERGKCGVVVAPINVEVPDLIRNLEEQLPWVQ
jgi:hypothetical protein